MNYYNSQKQYYCGIDLHANTLYVCIINSTGDIVFHKEIPATPDVFLKTIAAYKDNIVVGVESTFCWYWLADLCQDNNIEFVLGHALYMKAIHGGKAKNDKLDSHKIAVLLRGGMFPIAYVYPKRLRALRDLLRRRVFFARKRAELLSHVQMTAQQYNVAVPGAKLKTKKFREDYHFPFDDEVVQKMISGDLGLIQYYSKEIHSIEFFIKKKLKEFKEDFNFAILISIMGIGPVLGATILLEINDIKRFKNHGRFCSYSRLVKPEKTSAGKKTGGGGRKIGNPHLKWAFSEAAALMLRSSDKAKQYKQRLLKKHSKAKTMSIISHRIGKAVYYMLLRGELFDENKFFAH